MAVQCGSLGTYSICIRSRKLLYRSDTITTSPTRLVTSHCPRIHYPASACPKPIHKTLLNARRAAIPRSPTQPTASPSQSPTRAPRSAKPSSDCSPVPSGRIVDTSAARLRRVSNVIGRRKTYHPQPDSRVSGHIVPRQGTLGRWVLFRWLVVVVGLPGLFMAVVMWFKPCPTLWYHPLIVGPRKRITLKIQTPDNQGIS
ncbi:hypothetical protein BDV95DRAFT_217912 [Massariosphaeria phaeospora]|uniref:Uncharacterized protein n=1 Tax=Massariosphaeria phaeospora TaxID=100035 RepID=A0A7C8MIA4_9PLEO|nr:hypothetical protein BDV95DRAFT_217912 [Massariosphaeria phaeospora]